MIGNAKRASDSTKIQYLYSDTVQSNKYASCSFTNHTGLVGPVDKERKKDKEDKTKPSIGYAKYEIFILICG